MCKNGLWISRLLFLSVYNCVCLSLSVDPGSFWPKRIQLKIKNRLYLMEASTVFRLVSHSTLQPRPMKFGMETLFCSMLPLLLVVLLLLLLLMLSKSLWAKRPHFMSLYLSFIAQNRFLIHFMHCVYAGALSLVKHKNGSFLFFFYSFLPLLCFGLKFFFFSFLSYWKLWLPCCLSVYIYQLQ